MILNEIEINSYRSIVCQNLKITNNCMGFVGLNESGKTNLLNAIRLLGSGFPATIKDKSKITNELPRIRYYFTVQEEIQNMAKEYCNEELVKVLLIPYEKVIKKLEITKYCSMRTLEKEKEIYKKVKKYSIEYNIELNGQFYKLKDGLTIPAGTTVTYNDLVCDITKIQLINKELIPESLISSYEVSNIENIKKVVTPFLNQFLDKKVPQVVYWEYDDAYLVPSEITYDVFIKADKPSENCTPLFNIFLLSSRLAISDEAELIEKVTEWKSDSSMRRKDSNIITEDLNKYIKRIWQDYDQNLRIELEETKITIHINDPESKIGNFYEMESRSQGFKTFISFLLTTAAEIETDMLSNCIIILDEPETHLHPSGVKFMRDELQKLAKNNYIFYATHSIFMIDRNNLKKHFIVKKESEITKVIAVDRNNIIQESVIYEALGTTVDEFSIHPKNIIFEGEMDLLIFRYFVKNCLGQRNNHILEYELYDAGGTRNVITFFKNKVVPKESEWIIVLDSDVPGRNLPSEVKKNPLENGKMKYIYYSDVEGSELEDLLPEIFIIEAINRTKNALSYEEKSGFTLAKGKVVSKSINEYKYSNSINGRHEFEAIFKQSLIDILNENINTIKDTTIQKRHDSFKKMFELYYIFIKKLLKQLNYEIAEDGE